MRSKDMQNLFEESYKFIGISNKKKQEKIIKILNYCKEIRDTAYPIEDSNITELKLVEFLARKEKDLIYINGSLILTDYESERRTFEAYIIEDHDDSVRIYMDITRLDIEDEPKMIRTSEVIREQNNYIEIVTTYASTDSILEKVTTTKLHPEEKDLFYQEKFQQLSAL